MHFFDYKKNKFIKKLSFGYLQILYSWREFSEFSRRKKTFKFLFLIQKIAKKL
jgi:hypothetical protein